MAVVYDVRNAKTLADLKKKEDDFMKMLKLQTKLNNQYSEAIDEYVNNVKLDIKQVPPERRSVEQEQNDLIFQKQTAFENAKSIMRDDEAQKFVANIALPRAVMFNSNFADIAKRLEGKKETLTSAFLNNFLNRYTQLLESTRTGAPGTETGIVLPIQPNDLERQSENIINQVADRLGGTEARTVARLRGIMTELLENNQEIILQNTYRLVRALLFGNEFGQGLFPRLVNLLNMGAIRDLLNDINLNIEEVALDVNRLGEFTDGQFAEVRQILEHAGMQREIYADGIERLIHNLAQASPTQAQLQEIRNQLDNASTKEQVNAVIARIMQLEINQPISREGSQGAPQLGRPGPGFPDFSDAKSLTEPQIRALNRQFAQEYIRVSNVPKPSNDAMYKLNTVNGCQNVLLAYINAFLAEEKEEKEEEEYEEEEPQQEENVFDEVMNLPPDQREGFLQSLNRQKFLKFENSIQPVSEKMRFKSLKGKLENEANSRGIIGQNKKKMAKIPKRDPYTKEITYVPDVDKKTGLVKMEDVLDNEKRPIKLTAVDGAFESNLQKEKFIRNELIREFLQPPAQQNPFSSDFARPQLRATPARSPSPEDEEEEDSLIARMRRRRSGSNPREEEEGRGIRIGHATIFKPRHRRVVGKGIEPSGKEKYRQFGKLIIHVPSLKKGIFNIKFPSMASIPRFPQSYISQNAIDFLFDLLDNHKINSNHWNRLNPKEKRLIEGAIKFADLDDVLGIKPQIDEEYRRQLKEFQIIRGQIIAGNNAEQLLQQLEAYIKNFMENGHLSNKEGTEILQEIRQIV